jgi:hypothetical protein
MALPIIRPFSVFANGAKIATGSTHDYTWEGNRELQIADGEVFVSSGAQTTELTADNLVPYGGDVTLAVIEDAHKNGEFIQISIGLINGRIHKIDMIPTQFQYKSEMKNGTQTANVKFVGLAPQLVG